ncbi:hypothetical protein T484DRAFT_1934314 [Baffinella frigidus]|nr:hypothetical protein T484DRAFT_1934314 [Cryptophyta sp. CCMP2293]
MVYGIWCMVYGVWGMVYGVWCMVYGCKVYGVWILSQINTSRGRFPKADPPTKSINFLFTLRISWLTNLYRNWIEEKDF